MTTIYGLADETGRIRYVGRTIRPYNRLANHMSRWRRGRYDFRPTMVVIETCEDKIASKREAFWIKRGGKDLLNRLVPKFGAAKTRPACHLSAYVDAELVTKARAMATAARMPLSAWFRWLIAQAVEPRP